MVTQIELQFGGRAQRLQLQRRTLIPGQRIDDSPVKIRVQAGLGGYVEVLIMVTDFDQASRMSGIEGTATIQHAFPQLPSLVGMYVCLQVVVVPSSAPIGIDVKNGVQQQLGY